VLKEVAKVTEKLPVRMGVEATKNKLVYRIKTAA